MRLSIVILLGIATSLIIMAGCSTDFELNQPQETTVIYGVLDPSADTQWIKINKSFLGDGNNFEYAAISDCTVYENVTATVTEIGGASRVWALNEKYVPITNTNGIFYSDSQKVYYFVANDLNTDAKYDLSVQFDDARPAVTATANMVGAADFKLLFKQQMSAKIRFEDAFGSANAVYKSIEPQWDAVDNGRRYDLKLVYHYKEHRTNGSIVDKTIEWNQGSFKTINLDGSEEFSKSVSGEQFYNLIGSTESLDNVDDVDKRVAGNMDFLLTVSEDDLSTYLDVSEPVSGIVQDRPNFTNITNGVGIFSSVNRTVFSSYGGIEFVLNRNAVEELSRGQYTGNLKFCSDDGAYSTELFYCN